MAKKKNIKKKSVKKSSHVGTGLVLAGALAAATAGAYYFYGPEGKQHRKKLKSWTVRAKGEVMAKAERLKEVDAKVYASLVDEVAKKYKKFKTIDNKDVEKFKGELKRQWAHMERDMTKGVKKGKSTAKKVVRKVTKKKTTRKKK